MAEFQQQTGRRKFLLAVERTTKLVVLMQCANVAVLKNGLTQKFLTSELYPVALVLTKYKLTNCLPQ